MQVGKGKVRALKGNSGRPQGSSVLAYDHDHERHHNHDSSS
jgi:hypothetical protein